MLTITRHGTPSALPALLIAHGLFGSGRNWGAIAKRMSDSREVLAVDMRNHAGSFWDARHDYPAMAADLAQVIEAEGQKMDVLGHSMGGKAVMVLALTRPELVNRAVIADIAPVAYGHSQNELIHAMRGLDLEGLASRSEADRRLASEIEDPQVRAFLLQSLDLKAQPPRWRLHLDVLEAQMDVITGWPEDAEGTAPYQGPVLFLSGGASDYVKPSDRSKIRALFPRARMAKIPDAGHWLHAEQPRAFEQTLRVFLGDG
ncbi:alpha/beta fold hydrolase [Pararhodobacter oceanensis]|uniref:Alpha/beta hydrolase n=1 Tax=Pararhodobacter oceanensis TaxID=2172121 RepID=A0A2T8HYX2_9RHOB|nr:alpha/beta fold hydrolase [Pararhodobacter oceanensis]PVH30599.1 alpha/beta hydrolase [Pararhodobacter oceanensis]